MTPRRATRRAATALKQRYQVAERLLRVDPTSALRALDGIEPGVPGSVDLAIYKEALALRIIANSMLGLDAVAAKSARDLAECGPGERSSKMVATWLLHYSGDGARLAAPLILTGCGLSGCNHDSTVELALQSVAALRDPESRSEAAGMFAEARPDLPALKRMQAKTLRDAGRFDDAVGLLASLEDPAMRHTAGILLYDAARYAEAVSLLVGSTELHAAAALGANLAAGPEHPAPAPHAQGGSPALRAIRLETMGKWREASALWRDAGYPVESWEAGLMGGSTAAPVQGSGTRWLWRYYAVTGRGQPQEPPQVGAHQRYAPIGRARELMAAVRSGKRPRLSENEPDPFGIEGLLDLVIKGDGDPVAAASRLIAIDPPERPLDLLTALKTPPSRIDWLASPERRRIWREWVTAHPAAQATDPKVSRRALLAKTLRGDSAPTTQRLEALLKGLPAPELVAATGIMLAKDWYPGRKLARSLTKPKVIAASLDSSCAELLPAMALLAGSQGLPDDVRRTAGEIGGALVALAQARSEVSAESGRKAAAVIEDALAEVSPIADIFGPTSAYEHETSWLDGNPGVRAGPILASRAGFDAPAAKMRQGPNSRLYGRFGRARILASAGKLEEGLATAGSVRDRGGERAVVVREIKAELAARRAAVGDIDGATEIVLQSKPYGARAAADIARSIVDQVGTSQREKMIVQLGKLHVAFPGEGAISVALARILNQRAVALQRRDQPVSRYIRDLQRAADLDPASIQIRSNLAWTLLARGWEAWESDPAEAMRDLRQAVRTDPNSGDLHEGGARLALACGSVYANQQNRDLALECYEYALELDPSNDEAYRAAMAWR